jgi:hypothetical protein
MPILLSICADLRAAAMHDDRVDAGLLQERDIAGKGLAELGLPMAWPPYFTTIVLFS